MAILTIGFLCLGNTEFFKTETGDAQQIITSSLRDGSITLKRTILEIFQEYFSIEELKAEAREGVKKEDVDLSTDFGVFAGTASSIGTDEYFCFSRPQLTPGLHFSSLETIWAISWYAH